MKTKETSSSIVINTSPWLALSICNQVDLLPSLFDNVFIPRKVKNEIIAGGIQQVGVSSFANADWLKVRPVKDKDKVTFLHGLDQGEAEVIVLAKELGVEKVLIDERLGRLEAKVLGLSVMGTLGVLLKAKRQNLLTEIHPLIIQMRQGGIWIGEQLVSDVLKEAGE
jgi:uncharacterized protein